MPKVNRNVIGCSNSTYKINKRKKNTEHNLEAKGNWKKKGDWLEFQPLFHLQLFLVPLNVRLDIIINRSNNYVFLYLKVY